MAAFLPEELELIEKHEEILEKRAELLEQMESRIEQLKILREQQVKLSEAARHRNSSLLQDLKEIEDGLRGRPMTHPNVLALEARYWASVEESIGSWEHFLLGKGPHPIDGPDQTARRGKQNPSTANRGLPPRPKPKTAR
ncbi:putative protein C3orf14 [Channa argus]|uniref:Uncharacterized protein n=1 Tax=Channa argus TaxID=215402 RepID=A0A6G1PGG0_CHAAH|nr:putative protein C3orf14 [Channa argus]KAK2914595.1 hypothetical protein Q8A73_005189 [Channa argus]